MTQSVTSQGLVGRLDKRPGEGDGYGPSIVPRRALDGGPRGAPCDHLDNARPVRLTTVDGIWALELEVLMPVDESILRPSPCRVEGAELIMAYLQRMPKQPQLLRDAKRLLAAEGERGSVDRSFRPLGGAWVPVPSEAASAPRLPPLHPLPSGLDSESRPEDLGRVVAKVVELRGRVRRLECLAQRVAALESSVAAVSVVQSLEARVAELERLGGATDQDQDDRPAEPSSPEDGVSPDTGAMDASARDHADDAERVAGAGDTASSAETAREFASRETVVSAPTEDAPGLPAASAAP